jgi:hypothetical protein
MKKIPSVFCRNYDGDRLIRDEVVEGCEWVLAGEGTATRKWDGTACMVREGVLFKRYDVRRGKMPPVGAIPCEPEANEHTGHWPHWVAVGDGPDDRWFREALSQTSAHTEVPDGTYEACGPKINGNPERLGFHQLIAHVGFEPGMDDCPRTFDALREWMRDRDIEGVVFHHSDGRMAKVKKKDYGLKR